MREALAAAEHGGPCAGCQGLSPGQGARLSVRLSVLGQPQAPRTPVTPSAPGLPVCFGPLAALGCSGWDPLPLPAGPGPGSPFQPQIQAEERRCAPRWGQPKAFGVCSGPCFGGAPSAQDRSRSPRRSTSAAALLPSCSSRRKLSPFTLAQDEPIKLSFPT